MTEQKFGYETIGTFGYAGIENRVQGSVFPCSYDGIADSITAALRKEGDPWTGRVKCLVYRHSDLKRIGVTKERTLTLTGTYKWYTFTFASPKPLDAGTDYILAVWAEDVPGVTGAMVARDDPGWAQGHYQDVTYSTPPDPLVPMHWWSLASIYCTLTTTPPAPEAPTCRTDDASAIHQNDAKLHGMVTHDGYLTCQARFQYGKTIAYGKNTSWQRGKHTNDAVGQLISGLAKGITYHFIFQVQNPHVGSRVSGDDKTFTTSTTARGTLSVSAVSDEEVIKARVQVNGDFHNTSFEVDLEPGNYILNATYQSQTLPPQTAVITAGKTTTVTLRFTAMYKLTILLTPLEEITFTLNGSDKTTPFEQEMPSGAYTIVMPSSIQINNDIYSFSQWEDNSTNPSRTLSLTRDLTVTATYVKTAIIDPLTGITIPIIAEIEGAGPINQRQMKDVMREVVGQGGDLSDDNPLPVEVEPGSALGHGQQTVPTPGTAVRLTATSTPIVSVTVKSLISNIGIVYVGGPGLSADGYELAPNGRDSVSFDVDNLTDVWVDAAVADEGVSFVYLVS